MSQVLELAGRLRALSDDELVRLLRLRGGSSTSLKDFFDLAEWLLQPKHMNTFLNSLPKSSLAYASGRSDGKGNPLLDFLREARLVDFEVGGFAQAARAPRALVGEADSTAGIHAFETIASITELIFDLAHRILKDVVKQGLGGRTNCLSRLPLGPNDSRIGVGGLLGRAALAAAGSNLARVARANRCHRTGRRNRDRFEFGAGR